MTTATSRRQPELTPQAVVTGGAGIVVETARRAGIEGAGVILTGRIPCRRKLVAVCLPEQMGHVIMAVSPAVR